MRRRWRLLAVGVADGACAASHRLRQQPPHARSEEQHQPTYGECANLGAGLRYRAVYSEQFANAEGYEYSGIRPMTAEYANLRAGVQYCAVYSEHRVSPRGYECS